MDYAMRSFDGQEVKLHRRGMVMKLSSLSDQSNIRLVN